MRMEEHQGCSGIEGRGTVRRGKLDGLMETACDGEAYLRQETGRVIFTWKEATVQPHNEFRIHPHRTSTVPRDSVHIGPNVNAYLRASHEVADRIAEALHRAATDREC
jgi:hypothetical protein